jgi:hypothetical protein
VLNIRTTHNSRLANLVEIINFLKKRKEGLQSSPNLNVLGTLKGGVRGLNLKSP